MRFICGLANGLANIGSLKSYQNMQVLLLLLLLLVTKNLDEFLEAFQISTKNCTFTTRIFGFLHGSHGLSARWAKKMKSSRPKAKGPVRAGAQRAPRLLEKEI